MDPKLFVDTEHASPGDPHDSVDIRTIRLVRFAVGDIRTLQPVKRLASAHTCRSVNAITWRSAGVGVPTVFFGGTDVHRYA